MSCKIAMSQFYIAKPHLLGSQDSLEIEIKYDDLQLWTNRKSFSRKMGFKLTLTRPTDTHIHIQLTAKHPETEEDYIALQLELPSDSTSQDFVHFGFVASINPLYHIEGSKNNYRFRETNILFAS